MSGSEEETPQRKGARTATDVQRMRLEKLMKNIEKPAFIPDPPKTKKFSDAPEFVRNVMGSSAGAGSGEFHVYRHIRRREYSRQEYMNKLTAQEELDLEYQRKREDNIRMSEEKTAKKRAKRQKRKQKLKIMKLKNGGKKVKHSSSESETDEEEETDKTKEDEIASTSKTECMISEKSTIS